MEAVRSWLRQAGEGEERRAEKEACQRYMQAYLTCVERHERGLSDGDECAEEAEAYKACRRALKEGKSKTGQGQQDPLQEQQQEGSR